MPSDRHDSQKEIIRTAGVSESTAQKDSRGRTDITLFLDRPLRTNPFGQNISGDHVYRRAERIAAAVHLLTNHLAEDEPVRDSLRKESIRLLQLALELRNELRASGSEIFKRTQSCIRKLISLARLLGISGYASAQNTETLVEALDELGTLLTSSQKSTLAEDTILTRDELTPRANTEMRFQVQMAPRKRPLSWAKRQLTLRASIKDTRVKDRTGGAEGGSGPRSDRILDILKSGGILGIKDISSNLPEYSEKMVQRELAVLVSESRVRKFGAKRWSKYSIV